MKTIWKFELDVTDEQSVKMSAGAQIISALAQFGKLWVYAIVPDVPTPWARRRMFVRGTGHSLGAAAQAKFIGTVVLGPFVWHIFDGGEITQGQEPIA